MNVYGAKELKEMFHELKDAEPIEFTSRPSYNDGGHEISILWGTSSNYYRTKHSDYGVESRWTTIEEVQPYTFTETRFKSLSKRYYE